MANDKHNSVHSVGSAGIYATALHFVWHGQEATLYPEFTPTQAQQAQVV